MNLSAGDYRIAGAKENRIQVRWKVRSAKDLPRVRVQADVKGSEATLTTDGVRNGFEVDIQVPTRAGLRVRLTAGDLTVDGIEGNKDIELHVRKHLLQVLAWKPLPAHDDPDELFQVSDTLKGISFKEQEVGSLSDSE